MFNSPTDVHVDYLFERKAAMAQNDNKKSMALTPFLERIVESISFHMTWARARRKYKAVEKPLFRIYG